MAGFERTESQFWKKSYCGENAVKTAFHSTEKLFMKSVSAADFIFSITFICTGKQKNPYDSKKKKSIWFTLWQYSLYCIGLEPKWLYRQGMPVLDCELGAVHSQWPHPPRWLQLSPVQHIWQCSKSYLWCRLFGASNFYWSACGQNPWIFCRVLNFNIS